MTRAIALVVLASILSACSTTTSRFAPLAAHQFSGVVLVAKNGRPVYQQGTANRQYNIGSMTKMVTAVAIARLAERGKLAFDDPVGKHLPDFPNRAVAEGVTIHHLLTHSSGMGDYHNDAFYARRNTFRTLSDLVPLFASDSLSFEPGKGWDYSNAAFIVLGLIVEKVSGESYFDYVTKHIFAPAGMRDSEHRAESSSAGGTFSTVGDLLRFVTALNNGKLLTKPYAQRVTSPKVKVPPGWPMQEYGYGFQMSTMEGVRIVGHGGAGPGIAGKLDMYPDLGYTVIILASEDLPAIMPVIMKSRELVLAAAKQ